MIRFVCLYVCTCEACIRGVAVIIRVCQGFSCSDMEKTRMKLSIHRSD